MTCQKTKYKPIFFPKIDKNQQRSHFWWPSKNDPKLVVGLNWHHHTPIHSCFFDIFDWKMRVDNFFRSHRKIAKHLLEFLLFRNHLDFFYSSVSKKVRRKIFFTAFLEINIILFNFEPNHLVCPKKLRSNKFKLLVSCIYFARY